ncbi:hypothetical protein ACQRXC_03800 [Niallia taxi]
MLTAIKDVINDYVFAPIVGIAAGLLFLTVIAMNWDFIINFVLKHLF